MSHVHVNISILNKPIARCTLMVFIYKAIGQLLINERLIIYRKMHAKYTDEIDKRDICNQLFININIC